MSGSWRNKQPYYHAGTVKGRLNRTKVLKALKHFEDVLQDSVEAFWDKTENETEILFTAIDDLSTRVNEDFTKKGIELIHEFDAEPGDPADLM